MDFKTAPSAKAEQGLIQDFGRGRVAVRYPILLTK